MTPSQTVNGIILNTLMMVVGLGLSALLLGSLLIALWESLR